jgi:hypothetical protein
MQFCTKCGQQNNDTTKFCTKCGNALAKPQQQPVVVPPIAVAKKNNAPVLVAVAVLILVAATAGWYFFVKHTDAKNRIVESTNTSDTTFVTAPASSEQGRFPQGSQKLLTASELAGLSAYDLKIMRNEIFARHGYIFADNDLREYFTRQSWYNPQYADVASMLTDLERSNISLLKRMDENSTTTTAALFQVSGNEAIGSETNSAVSGKVQQFFDDGNVQNIAALLNYFSFPIRRYYEVNNYSYDGLKKRYERYYYKVLASHKMTINWGNSFISKTSEGYLVEINADYEYATQKKPADIHNLNTTIIMNLNDGYQIIEMYERN